jgi:hypothetical protein
VVSVVLSAAALGSLGALDGRVSPVAPPDLELSDLENRRETPSTQSSAVFYVVDSQTKAHMLEAAIARDWPALDPISQGYLTTSVFAADSRENAALIETLTAGDWTAELGAHVTVVDLREAGDFE